MRRRPPHVSASWAQQPSPLPRQPRPAIFTDLGRGRQEGLAVGGGARDVGRAIREAATESFPADVPMDGDADLCGPDQGGGGQR